MENLKPGRFFSNSSISTICGTALVIYGSVVFGTILVVLGICGSIVSFAMQVQRETRDREEREKLYENIKNAVGTSITGLTLQPEMSNQVH